MPIDSNNLTKILSKLSEYITNINWVLKNIKSNTVTDFIYKDYKELIITTNSITFTLDFGIICQEYQNGSVKKYLFPMFSTIQDILEDTEYLLLWW